MKKILLGTTALIAVGAMTSSAMAADKINLGMGGYWRAFFVVGSDERTNERGHGLAREGEVYFKGDTTLDNGLKPYIMVQLEAETSGDQIDNSYGGFKGGFGDVRIGSFWGPGVAMHHGDVGNYLSGHGNFASHEHIGMGAVANAAGTGYSTYAFNGGNSEKIAYYSPRMGGVQLGVSYAPDAVEDAGAASGLQTDNDGAGTRSERWDAGVNFVQTFGGVSVAASAVYTRGETEVSPSTEPTELALGGSVGVAGFKFGVAYRKTDADSGTNDETTTWQLGASYGMGPWAVGAVWANEEVEEAGGDDELTYMSVSGQYTLGPGISVMAGAQFYDWDGQAGETGDANVFVVGTRFGF